MAKRKKSSGSLSKAFEDLPMIFKFILALPGLDLIWNIYRLIKSIEKGNMLGIILAILLVFIGWAFLWILDMITVLVADRVLWIC